MLEQMLPGEVAQDSLTEDSMVLNLRTVASTVASTVAPEELARHGLTGLESLCSRVKFDLPVRSAAAETVKVWKPITINGWSYEREKDIWARTLTISCERHRAMILQAQLEKQHAFLEVRTLSMCATASAASTATEKLGAS